MILNIAFPETLTRQRKLWQRMIARRETRALRIARKPKRRSRRIRIRRKRENDSERDRETDRERGGKVNGRGRYSRRIQTRRCASLRPARNSTRNLARSEEEPRGKAEERGSASLGIASSPTLAQRGLIKSKRAIRRRDKGAGPSTGGFVRSEAVEAYTGAGPRPGPRDGPAIRRLKNPRETSRVSRAALVPACSYERSTRYD